MAYRQQFDGVTTATPSELRDAADSLSKGLAAEADHLSSTATDTMRRCQRKLNERGVRDDVAERDALGLKAAMLAAARLMMEAAQELDALTVAVDVYTETLHAGTNAQ